MFPVALPGVQQLRWRRDLRLLNSDLTSQVRFVIQLIAVA